MAQLPIIKTPKRLSGPVMPRCPSGRRHTTQADADACMKYQNEHFDSYSTMSRRATAHPLLQPLPPLPAVQQAPVHQPAPPLVGLGVVMQPLAQQQQIAQQHIDAPEEDEQLQLQEEQQESNAEDESESNSRTEPRAPIQGWINNIQTTASSPAGSPRGTTYHIQSESDTVAGGVIVYQRQWFEDPFIRFYLLLLVLLTTVVVLWLLWRYHINVDAFEEARRIRMLVLDYGLESVEDVFD
jgi:hypothetical protein